MVRTMLELKNVSTAQELYTVIENVKYDALTDDDKSALLVSYEMVVDENTHVPESLDKTAYCKMLEELASINETINKREEVLNMDKTMKNLKASVNTSLESIWNKTHEFVVEDGMTMDEFVADGQERANDTTGTFMNIVHIVGDVTHTRHIVDTIGGILDAGGSLKEMARECKKVIKEEVEFLELCGTEDTLRKAAAWKTLIINEDGDKGVYHKSVFEVFFSGLNHIGQKIARKIDCGKESKSKIISAICKGVSAVGALIRMGVRFVGGIITTGVSYLTAGAIKLVKFLVTNIVKAAHAVTGFINRKLNEDDIDDDCFEDDDIIVEN